MPDKIVDKMIEKEVIEKEIIETNSREETYDLGFKLGQKAQPGTIYALDADLGCGKTVFSQGLAAGLGITQTVNSPTFNILKVYEKGRLPFYHFDVYRIGDISEMDEIGCEDFFYGEGVCVIEWADMIRELIPDTAVWIHMARDLSKGMDYRRIEMAQQDN